MAAPTTQVQQDKADLAAAHAVVATDAVVLAAAVKAQP